MAFAENPNKVNNIVSGSYPFFHDLYKPVLERNPFVQPCGHQFIQVWCIHLSWFFRIFHWNLRASIWLVSHAPCSLPWRGSWDWRPSKLRETCIPPSKPVITMQWRLLLLPFRCWRTTTTARDSSPCVWACLESFAAAALVKQQRGSSPWERWRVSST